MAFLLAVIILGLCILFVWLTERSKKRRQAEEEAIERIQREKKLLIINKKKLYAECYEAGATDFTTEKNRARIKLVAEKYGFYYPDVVRGIFQEGKELYEAERKKQEAQELRELRKQELRQYNELNRYANLPGTVKILTMLKDEMAALGSNSDKIQAFADKANSLLMQKERDWATAGGIASGIAGGAAGLATAMEIQAQNAQIRAQNQEMAAMIARAQLYLEEKEQEKQAKVERLMEEYEREYTKLVSDMPASEVLSYLVFKDPEISVTKTGAIRVNVYAKLPKQLIIFDDLKAKIDGTVIAEIRQGDEIVKRVKLVLPKYGISTTAPRSTDRTYLCGMALSGGKQDAEYTVTFTATHLYAIEK